MTSTTEIISVCELINGTINRLKHLIQNATPFIGKWESDIESINLMMLICRDLESVTILARNNVDFLPSAMILTRSIFEKAVKVMWIIQPDDPYKREIRWLAQFKTEEDHFSRLAKRFYKFGIDANKVLKTSDLIKEFRTGVQNKLPTWYVPLKSLPDLNSMLRELDEEKKYVMFLHLSQFTHGTHIATGIYRQGLGTMKQAGEPITSRDWQIIFEVCFFCVGNTGLRLVKRLGSNPEDYIDRDTVNLIQDSIAKLGNK